MVRKLFVIFLGLTLASCSSPLNGSNNPSNDIFPRANLERNYPMIVFSNIQYYMVGDVFAGKYCEPPSIDTFYDLGINGIRYVITREYFGIDYSVKKASEDSYEVEIGVEYKLMPCFVHKNEKNDYSILYPIRNLKNYENADHLYSFTVDNEQLEYFENLTFKVKEKGKINITINSGFYSYSSKINVIDKQPEPAKDKEYNLTIRSGSEELDRYYEYKYSKFYAGTDFVMLFNEPVDAGTYSIIRSFNGCETISNNVEYDKLEEKHHYQLPPMDLEVDYYFTQYDDGWLPQDHLIEA